MTTQLSAATVVVPGGRLTVAVTQDGVVHRSLFGTATELRSAFPGAIPVAPEDLPAGWATPWPATRRARWARWMASACSSPAGRSCSPCGR